MNLRTHTPPKIPTLIFLTGISVLSLNMFLPSLSNIARDFQADYSLVSFSISGYLGITALLQLMIGPLSDRFGRRPILLYSLFIFGLASLGCLIAPNIWVFLSFRIMQGVIVSGWVISLAIIRDTVPEKEAASLIGYISMAMAVAPMLGPVIGGILDESFGWRSNFLFFTTLGIALYGVCWLDLGETNQHRSETLTTQLQTYPELFRSRQYWGYALCIMFSGGAFYAFLAGTPLIAETILSLSPAELGFYMGTITIGFMGGSFLSGRYAKQFPLTTMMITGRLFACIGLIIGLLFFWAGMIHEWTLFGSTIFVGVGNGLTLPGASAGAMSVSPRLAGSASGLTGALAVGGGAIITSFTGTVLTNTYGAYQLLGIMLFCSFMALVAALYVKWH